MRLLLSFVIPATVQTGFVTAWSVQSPSSLQSSNKVERKNVNRRSFLEVLGISGAAISSSVLQPDQALADNTANVVGTKQIEILWRTQPGFALPVNPSTVLNVFQKEVFGPRSVADNSLKSLPQTGIVCVSERHDDFEHHRVQLRIIQTMYKALKERIDTTDTTENIAGKSLSIAMEAFQRRDKKALDKFIASGESGRYTLSDLRRDTNWDENWGYDMLHYALILKYAQKKGIRLIGLQPSNTELETVEKFGLAGMKPSTVSNVITTDKAHKEQFMKIFVPTFSLEDDFNGNQEAMDAHMERLYEVQCFREEYMAESAALHVDKEYYAPGSGGWITILAGENHVLGRNGIPFRTLRRVARKQTAAKTKLDINFQKRNNVRSRGVFTIVPRATSFPIALKDAPGISSADYVWFLERDPRIPFDENIVNLAPRQPLMG